MFTLLPQQQPVIVHIEPAPSENASAVRDLTRVIVGSLGLTGALLIVAVVVGVGIGATLYWIRSRS